MAPVGCFIGHQDRAIQVLVIAISASMVEIEGLHATRPWLAAPSAAAFAKEACS